MLTRGTQIVYVPTHANGDTQHPDAEPGFVTSMNGDVAFCRYWSKSNPDQLRTTVNSEATPVDTLVVADTRPQAVVDTLLQTVR